MSESYIQARFAERIGGHNYGKSTTIYKFEKIKRAKREYQSSSQSLPLLDFGIGENDQMAAPLVREALKIEVDKLENRGYADNGIPEFKDAATKWLKETFNVDLNPQSEVNHCIGSKSALSLLPLGFINPGDVTLLTVPGYPIAGTYTKYCGGAVHPLILREQNNFFPELTSIPPNILERTKLLVLNYPNSPTGALATEDFYKRVIDFAVKHKIVVIQDAAHIVLSYGSSPLSFLSIPGAKEVGVELHSLSKGFNMIGWRLGFVAGNALIVKAFSDIKDNSDSGQFIAIQKAAIKALNDSSIPQEVRRKYQRRLQKLVQTLADLKFSVKMPGGTYFLYTPAPKAILTKEGIRVNFENAEECSQFLIRERGICCVPWDEAGPHLRFSVTYLAENEEAEDQLMQALIQRLGDDRFEF